MPDERLQSVCELGQQLLMETRYLEAAHTLAEAENQAWNTRDFDTLSRLYLPLQEARRQIRQRCGEGAVRMRMIASGPDDTAALEPVVPTQGGCMLVAGWADAQPSIRLRRTIAEKQLYAETFLASVSLDERVGRMVLIVPSVDSYVPPVKSPDDRLGPLLDLGSFFVRPDELPPDSDRGTAGSFAAIMSLWERLHTPYLKAAKCRSDPIEMMQAYRTALRVDPACELAHQFLADIARKLARQ